MNKEYNNKYNTEEKEEKILDRNLIFDAFSGGIDPGGLRSISSIHLMIGYLVANFQNKATAQNIIDTLVEGGIANYFQTADAIGNLLKNDTIAENDDKTLRIVKDGQSSVELIENDLPFTVRKKAIHLLQKLIAKENYRKESNVQIEETKDGYNIIMHISDGDVEYFKLKLYATTITQAELIREKFVTDPVSVYNTLIDSIFANED